MKRFLATMIMCLLSVSIVNAQYSNDFDGYADWAAMQADGWALNLHGAGANYWDVAVDSGFVISNAVGDSTDYDYDAEYTIDHAVTGISGDFDAIATVGWDFADDNNYMGGMGIGVAVTETDGYFSSIGLGHWMGVQAINEIQIDISKPYPDVAAQAGFDFGAPYDADGGTLSASGVTMEIKRIGQDYHFIVNGIDLLTRTRAGVAVDKVGLYAVTYNWGGGWNDGGLGPQFADSISITPEPTLMGLLAAGALWLRRRVK